MVTAKLLISKTCPEKMEEFHPTNMPPEAPCEGEKANLSNLLGANFFMYECSKCSLLVSCKQKIEQALSSIFALTALCLPGSLIPLIFQFRMFQFLVFVVPIGNSVMQDS